MLKKLFALLFACLLILMSFTACGTKTPESDSTAAEDTSEAISESAEQTSAEETQASSEAVSETAESEMTQSTQKPASGKPASKPASTTNPAVPPRHQRAGSK